MAITVPWVYDVHMTTRERVDALERRLITTEVARRKAVRDGNTKLHNDLANMNREAVGEMEPKDLRSLVTRWMLQLGKAADQAQPVNVPNPQVSLFGPDAHGRDGRGRFPDSCGWPNEQCIGHVSRTAGSSPPSPREGQ